MKPVGSFHSPRGPHSQFDRPQRGRPIRGERSTDGPSVTQYTQVYEYNLGFGDVLRQFRIEKGLSLREVGEHLGKSHSYIQRLETGRRVKKPTLEQLHQIAMLFGRPVAEIERLAGVRREPLLSPDRVVHEQFQALVLEPELRPPGMSEEWLTSFSVRQKQQWVYFALKLNPEQVERILLDAGVATSRPNEGLSDPDRDQAPADTPSGE